MAAAKPPVAVPALERLSQLSIVNIKETSKNYSGNNYTVLAEGDEVVLTMKEIVPEFHFVGQARRPFQFDGMDNMGSKLFTFIRTLESTIVSHKVDLFMNEELVSVIQTVHTLTTPIFNINDGLNNPIIRLKGKKTDFDYFQLQTKEKTGIGAIQRTYPSLSSENCTLIDNYVINFPIDLAVPFKIAVIVACVYIDFIFHESQ